jgi:hypothetical protein
LVAPRTTCATPRVIEPRLYCNNWFGGLRIPRQAALSAPPAERSSSLAPCRPFFGATCRHRWDQWRIDCPHRGNRYYEIVSGVQALRTSKPAQVAGIVRIWQQPVPPIAHAGCRIATQC